MSFFASLERLTYLLNSVSLVKKQVTETDYQKHTSACGNAIEKELPRSGT